MSHNLNHVAVSVPDVDAASQWYVDTLGFTRLRATSAVDRETNPEAVIFKIYPSSLRRVRTAYLSAGNGIGFEQFEFQEPQIQAGSEAKFERDYHRGGFFHAAVTTNDIDGLADRVVKAGGKLIGETICIYADKARYVEDPWGNVLELMTASFEQIMSNR